MTRRILFALLSSVLITSHGIAAAQASSGANCAYDRERMLAMNEAQFDQDTSGGGWRALESRPGCELVAADLVRDYRLAHKEAGGLLVWHEAQLRAFGGQPKQAIVLMEQARGPAQTDRMGWNPYVDATIAFLRKDRTALAQAKAKLLAVPAPVGEGIPPVIDGHMVVDMSDGTTRKIRWPQNIDVVEGLENCFDKSYSEAYAGDCRPRTE